MKFTAVTFYTPDYEDVVLNLGKSCQKLGIKLKAYAEPDRGSWVLNCGIKPEVIRRAMDEFKTPVVWIDADAVVRSYPQIFDDLYGTKYHFACHFREYNHHRDRELLSGTLWFNDNKGGIDLLEKWVRQQKKCKTHWDQQTLAHVVQQGDYCVKELPASYTQIFDTMAHNGVPVIEHFQESRKKVK